MGIGNRRGAARGATAKSKMGSEMGKSASPRLASEVAHLSDDGGGGRAPPTKGKGKAKGKKTGALFLSLGLEVGGMLNSKIPR